MASGVLIPVSEYLRTSYQPDCDYVDGELEERNFGEQDHSDLQSRLIMLLGERERRQHVRVNSELRVQVEANHYRVPDVCVRRADAPSEQIVVTPPLACIEILSPKDLVSKTLTRIRKYLAMGVREVWLLDPERRSVAVYVGSTSNEQTEGLLKVPGTPVEPTLEEIFAVLDEYQG